jgi:hypothetical protein
MGTYTDLLNQKPDSKPETARSGEQPKTEKSTRKPTQEDTSVRGSSRVKARVRPRQTSREKSRDLPTRDEIQEFSFRLRDELKARVKVQAEVPHQWQEELDEVARQLRVKKLELYRFILGEFLGKVKRKQST